MDSYFDEYQRDIEAAKKEILDIVHRISEKYRHPQLDIYFSGHTDIVEGSTGQKHVIKYEADFTLISKEILK